MNNDTKAKKNIKIGSLPNTITTLEEQNRRILFLIVFTNSEWQIHVIIRMQKQKGTTQLHSKVIHFYKKSILYYSILFYIIIFYLALINSL